MSTSRLLALALAALDASWVFGWSALLGLWVIVGDDRPLLPWLAILLFLLAARSGSRWIRALSGQPKQLRLVLALGGMALAVLVAFLRYGGAAEPSGPVMTGVFVLWLWWRGLRAGRGPVDFDTLEGAFGSG